MADDKFEPKIITLFASDKGRMDSAFELEQFVDALPRDKVFTATIRQGEESRSSVANRLYQSVIGQMAKQMRDRSDNLVDSDPSVIAGKLKFHILLPLKPVMAAEFEDDKLRDEAVLERTLCDMIAASDKVHADDLYPAYDRAIRSKTLNVRPFARYLDRVIEKLAVQGFNIRLQPSEVQRALGEQRQARAA